ncbi:MAG: sigma-70 family RNA polymerase sigma factor [Bacilli bacterium]|nr:sigma-70 family RNA polymerase sigma factor [Bacilli bacterium]
MYNDYELLYSAGEKNEDAINILYQKYEKTIYAKATKYNNSYSTFDDFLNEAKLIFYDAIENYKDSTKFSTYLNKCLDYRLLNYKISLERNKYKILNDAKSINDEKNEYLEIIYDEKSNPEKLILDEIEYTELKQKILTKLTWKEELVLILKEQNYNNKEISEITDNNLKTVYNIISRLERKIKKIM